MQSSELESGSPDEAEQEMVEKNIGIFILKKIPNGLPKLTAKLYWRYTLYIIILSGGKPNGETSC